MDNNEVLFFQYYFTSKGHVNILYNKESNRFYLAFEGVVSEHNKEWFSRICLQLNNHLAVGYKYDRVELSVSSPDTAGKIKVNVSTSESKNSSLFQVTKEGDFYHLDDKNNIYHVIHDPELSEIFERLNKIVNKKYIEIGLDLV